MVIDQFEELFTLSQRRAQERFLETLAAVVDPAASRVRAVMAMRADFYGICATFPWLARRITANQVLVGPMSLADLKKVIEQPAVRAGLRLEDGTGGRGARGCWERTRRTPARVARDGRNLAAPGR